MGVARLVPNQQIINISVVGWAIVLTFLHEVRLLWGLKIDDEMYEALMKQYNDETCRNSILLISLLWVELLYWYFASGKTSMKV